MLRRRKPPRKRNPNGTLDEYTLRRERERSKALEKYGPRALDPGGDPTLDVIDYTINELVGLSRYAEMIESRMAALVRVATRHRLRTSQTRVLEETRQFARMLEGVAATHAMDLIALWQECLQLNTQLGKPEGR